MKKNKTIIFLIGAGHSGSTLVSKTLNSHSKMFAISEISQFYKDIQIDNALCGCESYLRECEFWNDIDSNLQKKLGYGIKESPNLFRISRDLDKNSVLNKGVFKISRLLALNFKIRSAFINNRLKNICVLFDVIFEKTKAEVIIDSSKSAKRAAILKPFFVKEGYNVKIIHLIRDGRAVFYSYKKGYYKLKIKNESTGIYEMKTVFTGVPKTDEEIIGIWKKDNRLSSYYHNFFTSSNYYKLYYESFTNNPKEEFQKLINFIGFEFEDEMLDLTRYKNHMVAGNASRINATSIHAPLEIWRDNLTIDELAYFNKKARRMNESFGYK